MQAVSAIPAEQVYSREEVRRFLGISERQLRSWEQHGLVAERQSFGLIDVLALNTLVKLRQNHVRPAQVRRAVAALREKVRDVSDPLTQLRIYSEDGQIRVHIDGSTMEPVSGQLLLNFGPAELNKLLAFPAARAEPPKVQQNQRRVQSELLFEKGLQMEQTGAPAADIVAVYDQAIALDPKSTGALVNLGTVYFNLQKFNEAESCYLRAIEADPKYALAHFNLGNLYDEQGKRALALEQYLLALKANPQYADAHYNLALLYQTIGETMQAVLHWKAYLKVDPGSPWSIIARRELDKLKDATIVRGRR